MQDEEIKLPAMSVLYGILMTDDIRKAVEDYAREAVRLNQPQAELLPFNLEAAKRGDPLVMRNGEKARYIGHIQERGECFVYMENRKGWVVVGLDGIYSNVGDKSEFDVFMGTSERIACVTKVGSARFGVCEKNVHHSGIPIGAENASHIINISAGYKSGKQADDAVTRIRDFIENGCV